jgi:hypothetical protein
MLVVVWTHQRKSVLELSIYTISHSDHINDILSDVYTQHPYSTLLSVIPPVK